MRRLRRRSAARLFASPPRDRSRDRVLLERLRCDAERLAGHFGLTFVEIRAERATVRRRYGVCFGDGRIAVRLNHARSGKSLKYSSLINTLCHELAHLRHFNHGRRFKGFYFRILDYARREGIYQPRKASPLAAIQMDLFTGGPDPGEGRLPAAKGSRGLVNAGR